jgi:hypothetical protein
MAWKNGIIHPSQAIHFHLTLMASRKGVLQFSTHLKGKIEKITQNDTRGAKGLK